MLRPSFLRLFVLYFMSHREKKSVPLLIRGWGREEGTLKIRFSMVGRPETIQRAMLERYGCLLSLSDGLDHPKCTMKFKIKTDPCVQRHNYTLLLQIYCFPLKLCSKLAFLHWTRRGKSHGHFFRASWFRTVCGVHNDCLHLTAVIIFV